MLCSVQSSKSGSNWLDRLWSNKGFHNNNDDDPSPPNPSSSPITNASNSVINSNSGSTHSDSDQNKVPTTAAATTREVSSSDNKDLFFFMNNVLADLFNMGGGSDPIEESSRLSRKKEKIPRKQTKPKYCFISGNNNSSNDSLDCVRKDQNTGSSNSDKNSNNVDCGVDDEEEEEDVEEEEEKEKEKGFGVSGDKELKGYSRSEVTVIDTSCQVWKFDKLVFRKKNVWKVRDKKGKSWVFGSKKRKGNDLESANGNGAKKKAKVANLDVGSSKDANDIQKPEDEKREEVHYEMPEDLSQVPKKRIHCSRSPDKSNKSGSSVILIKAIPTSNKSGRNVTKNRLKDTQIKSKT